MKRLPVLLVSIFALASTGCMSDRTGRMAETCRSMLVREDLTGTRTFIRDAEAQLASLEGPANALMRYLRDFQDPDAMKHKPALEQCLWQLKSRQS